MHFILPTNHISKGESTSMYSSTKSHKSSYANHLVTLL